MITDSELAYDSGELVSVAFLALLLSSSVKIKHYSAQQRWFNANLLSQIIYLTGDSINILFLHRINWTSSVLPRLYLYQLNSTIEDATIDSLTGLRNRENLKDYLDSIWQADVGD